MKRFLRFILGYIFGGSVFLFIIPAGFYGLSMLDYIFDYRMIINSIVLRFIISGVALLVGLFFMIWSNIILANIGKGGPAEGFGVAISPKTQKLVIRGPYKVCRHPMVFGLFLIYLGVVVYLNTFMGLIALAVLLACAVFYLKYSEEKRLLKDFALDFPEYRKKVPMIFPLRRKTRIV